MIRSWQGLAEEAKKLLGRQVIIKYSKKASYHKLKGAIGTVKKISGSSIGVEIDACPNNGSDYNVWWFTRNELRLCSEEECNMLKTYDFVACVNLVEDSMKRDYYFALFKEDQRKLAAVRLAGLPELVVTNAGGKSRRVVGIVTKVLAASEYEGTPTAEVVAVINTENYEKRLAKETTDKAIEEKRKQIENELRKEADKHKDAEFYRQLASQYPDNKDLQRLVDEFCKLHQEE